MSLDVYLTIPHRIRRETSGIFVRENGQTIEISRAEWDEQNPDREPFVAVRAEETNTAYSANITHNLTAMAKEAGIYKHLWRPEEIGISKAVQLVKPLRKALALMKADPPRFEKHNARNGWGLYEDFVPWLEKYLAACEDNPAATVSVSR